MDTSKLYDLFEQIEASTNILLEEISDFQKQVDKLKDALDRLEIELIQKDVMDAGSISIKVAMSPMKKQFIIDFLRKEKARLINEEVRFLDRMLTMEEVDKREMEKVQSIFSRIDRLNKLNYNQ